MGTAGNGNRSVLLKFYAQAASNAHVMLANEPASYGYEIVIGGGSNRFSEIRRSSRYTDSDLTNRSGGRRERRNIVHSKTKYLSNIYSYILAYTGRLRGQNPLEISSFIKFF